MRKDDKMIYLLVTQPVDGTTMQIILWWEKLITPLKCDVNKVPNNRQEYMSLFIAANSQEQFLTDSSYKVK